MAKIWANVVLNKIFNLQNVCGARAWYLSRNWIGPRRVLFSIKLFLILSGQNIFNDFCYHSNLYGFSIYWWKEGSNEWTYKYNIQTVQWLRLVNVIFEKFSVLYSMKTRIWKSLHNPRNLWYYHVFVGNELNKRGWKIDLLVTGTSSGFAFLKCRIHSTGYWFICVNELNPQFNVKTRINPSRSSSESDSITKTNVFHFDN